ncbi:MAG: aspartate carbamoyltransferase [Promethearchaeota archaeon]
MKYNKPLRHIFCIDSLTKKEIRVIINRAGKFKKKKKVHALLNKKIVGLIFLEPSTRTRIGFDVAIKKLGGMSTLIKETKYESRMARPESLEDTVRVTSAYCDLLIIRHSNSDSLKQALEASSVPVINAGSGHEHHPTQALLDLFYIHNKLNRLEKLKIGLVGDLAGSRSAHSLVRALIHWPPSELRLMTPLGLGLPDDLINLFSTKTVSYVEGLDTSGLDVLYMAGLPGINGTRTCPKKVRSAFALTLDKARKLPEKCIIMCPLPRIDEIQHDVDSLHNSAYFTQSADGLFVRMAVLEYIFK